MPVAVRGAHPDCNSRVLSCGIALIGSFQSLKPTQSTMRASFGALLVLSLWGAASTAQLASDGVPKLVELVVDGDWLMASNVRASRFDELKLNAQERVSRSGVGKAVIVVITNQRIIGYGVGSGWRSMSRIPNEQIEMLSAEDYAGLVVTSRRLLNFNGESGVWGEKDRQVGR